MNIVYPSAVLAFLLKAVDISTDQIMCQAVGEGYVLDPMDSTLADLDDLIDDPVPITFDTISEDGAVFVEGFTFIAVPTGSTITGLVFYVDVGPGILLCRIDRRADTVPLSIVTNDGDVSFAGGRLFRL